MTTGSGTYFLAYDQVGSLRVVADGSGNPVKRTDYDSFGNVFSDSDPNFAVPFGFAGGLYDRDTGLVRFGYRDYDPDTGRWTAKDPIGFNGGDTDLYGYCVGDPVNLSDPSGKLAPLIVGAVAGAVGGAITGYLGTNETMTPMEKLKATVQSAAAGALAGVITGPLAGKLVGAILKSSVGVATGIPAIAAINGVSAGTASAIGQVVGNWVQCKPATQNFSWGAVAGASIGGAGTVVTAIEAEAFESVGAGIIQGVWEGQTIGTYEFLGSKLLE